MCVAVIILTHKVAGVNSILPKDTVLPLCGERSWLVAVEETLETEMVEAEGEMIEA